MCFWLLCLCFDIVLLIVWFCFFDFCWYTSLIGYLKLFP